MLKSGDRAPDFTLKSVDGQPVGLRELLNRGQLLLAFFKISCPTCQYTLPFLNRLRGENVVSVSQDDAAGTREFNEAFQVNVPTLLDSAREHYPASNAYGLTHVPTFYLIEASGIIARAFYGFSRVDLEEAAASFGKVLFESGERTPEFRPG
jgi:peroxiredoxin